MSKPGLEVSGAPSENGADVFPDEYEDQSGEESDEYELNERDAYGDEEEEEEEEEEEGEEGEGQDASPKQPFKGSLTALLLGDENGAQEEEEDEDDEQWTDPEESPVSPTNTKKRAIEEVEKNEKEESAAKKVKA